MRPAADATQRCRARAGSRHELPRRPCACFVFYPIRDPSCRAAGHPSTSKPFTEEIWGDLNGPDMHGYPKSKVRST